ncbi:MAG TPA: DNA repair protein RecO [Acidisarcina sp.]|nr:DNA repair protein RecO [Acidisarcina sp.]
MIAHQAEAIVLRTWPLHEADQIVSLFTRDQGKIKGVAKAAMKSRRRFGGALEPMTYVRASYAEKPRQELVRLDSCEILSSPLSQPVDYARAAVLAFFSEVLEDTLPDHDPQETVFRLLLAVLEYTRVEQPWMPLTYFALWVTRLMGWLPDLSRCVVCGVPLAGAPAFFHAQANGFFCAQHKRGGYSQISPDSHALALRVFRSPISGLAPEPWPRHRAADLRRFALQSLERNMERKLTTASVLYRLGG